MKYNLDIIEAILVKEDLEGFIKMGCPSDEYSYEAKLIHSRLCNEKIRDVRSIATKVLGVFIETLCTGTSADETDLSISINSNSINFYTKNSLDRIMVIAKSIYNCSKEE